MVGFLTDLTKSVMISVMAIRWSRVFSVTFKSVRNNIRYCHEKHVINFRTRLGTRSQQGTDT